LHGEADEAEEGIDDDFGGEDVPASVTVQCPDEEIAEAGDGGDERVIAPEGAFDGGSTVEDVFFVEDEVDEGAQAADGHADEDVSGEGEGQGEAGEVDCGGEDGREVEARENEVDAHGIPDGIEVRGTIAVDVDGLDGDFERLAGAADVGEDGHLVLVVFAVEDHELGEDAAREGAEAGLCVH